VEHQASSQVPERCPAFQWNELTLLRWLLFQIFASRPMPGIFPSALAKILSTGQKETANERMLKRHQNLTLPKDLYKSGILRSSVRCSSGLALPLLKWVAWLADAKEVERLNDMLKNV